MIDCQSCAAAAAFEPRATCELHSPRKTNKELGDEIRTLRLEANFSRGEVTRHFGISMASLVSMEMGESRPTLPFLESLRELYRGSRVEMVASCSICKDTGKTCCETSTDTAPKPPPLPRHWHVTPVEGTDLCEPANRHRHKCPTCSKVEECGEKGCRFIDEATPEVSVCCSGECWTTAMQALTKDVPEKKCDRCGELSKWNDAGLCYQCDRDVEHEEEVGFFLELRGDEIWLGVQAAGALGEWLFHLINDYCELCRRDFPREEIRYHRCVLVHETPCPTCGIQGAYVPPALCQIGSACSHLAVDGSHFCVSHKCETEGCPNRRERTFHHCEVHP